MKNSIPVRQRFRRGFGLVSFLMFPVTIYYFSPYLCIDGASNGIVTGSLLVFAGLFVVSLAFGRSFCSWVCPAGAAQDFAVRVNDKPLRKKGIDLMKYIIWVPWFVLIALMFVKAGGVKQVDPLYQTDRGISVANRYAYILYYAILALFMLPALFGRRRLSCHAFCWMAPFMVAGTKIKNALRYPSLHLETNSSKCVSCKVCEAHCPMSLPVSAMVAKSDMRHNECILCGECVDGCASKAIRFGWKHIGHRSNTIL